MRESSGSTNIERTLLKAVKVLALFHIPHYICGGVAVQEQGYPGPLTLPMPTNVSDQPQLLTLEKLISSKLSTYIGVGIRRAQDFADVVELMQANHLPRDFAVDPAVRDLYCQTWDQLQSGHDH